MTITTTGNATSTPMVIGNTALGTLTINGAPAETRTDVKVGVTATGNGTLTLNNGASLTIADPGSIADNRIQIGGLGTALLVVQNSSDIVVNGGAYASLDIASQAGSVGTATFTGIGSTFTSNLADNGIMVGYLGNATLNVLAGAVVKTLCFNAAYGANADGVVNVSGAGSQLMASNDGGTWATHAGDGGFMRFGSNNGADGRLNVTSGGLVEVRNTTDQDFMGFELGNNTGSYGKATIDGAGSKFWVHAIGTGESPYLRIGREGKGLMEVQNNGEVVVEGLNARLVVSEGDGVGAINLLSELKVLSGGDANISGNSSEIVIGQNIDGNGKVTVTGAGSTLNLTGLEATLFVGQGGSGELIVSAGGIVTVNQLGGGYDTVNIGTDAGSTGTVTVTGTGSKLVSVGSTADEIVVGNQGAGTLNIAAGGEVSGQRLFAGNEATGNGTVTVSGTNSKLNIAGPAVFDPAQGGPELVIGNRGTGILNLNNSAIVNVTGDSAVLRVGHNYAAVGPGDNGTVNILSGAILTVDHGDTLTDNTTISVGSHLFGNGAITVSGAGSKLVSLGTQNTIQIGNEGQGLLNISAGGEVSAGRMFIGGNQAGTGTVVVTGAGSKLNISGPAIFDPDNRNPALWVGGEGTGTMTLSNGAVANITGDRANVFVGDAYGVGAPGETGTLNVQSGAVMTINHGTSSYYHSTMQIGNQQFGNGTVTVTGAGSKIVSIGNNDRITVGNQGTGLLNVLAGGAIEGQMIDAGQDPTGTGTVLIDGAATTVTLASGAVFDAVQERARMIAGTRGDGTIIVRNGAAVNITGARAELHVGAGFDNAAAIGIMSIQSGAKVTVDHGISDPFWNVIIGDGANATGTLNVKGAGTLLISAGIDNQVTVGASGKGTLNVSAGGEVRAWALNVGNDGTGNGTVTVTGPNSRILLSNDNVAGGGDSAIYGGQLAIGRAAGSVGVVNILAGAHLDVRNTLNEDGPLVNLGRDVGSTGTMIIDGTGSQLNISQTGASAVNAGGPFLNIGRYGDGTVEVRNNAQINITGEYGGFRVSRGHDDNLTQPQVAQSEFRILSGADVTVTMTNGQYGAYGFVAGRKNANGLLTIDGTGSTLTLNGNDDVNTSQETAALSIGRNGLGIANVTNGADVVINGNDDRHPILEVGRSAGATGTLTVSGTGTTINILSTNIAADGGALIAVGRFAGSTGTLNITNGAQVINDLASTNSVTMVGNSGAFGADPAAVGSVVVDGNGNASTLLDAGQLLVVGAFWNGAAATIANVGFSGAGTGSVAALDGAIVRANLIAVGSGGMLSGNSTFDGAVTLDGGGKIAPGASPGVLTITGALDVVHGVFDMEVNGLTAGTLYDQVKVNGAVTLGNADFNIVAGAGFSFADGNRIVLIDGATTLAASNIGLVDAIITGEPVGLGWQIADEGADLVFEALNNGTGAAQVDFGAASAVASIATFNSGSGTGTGGRFNSIHFKNATGLDGTAAVDTFTNAGTVGAVFNGLGGNDVLKGGSGNDTLDGGLGNDSMTGGLGNDTYTLNTSLDSTVEALGGGTDLVKASVTHALRANVENLELTGTGNINGTGNALVNDIKGNSGSNILNGLAGADSMTGFGGNDTYYVDDLGDSMSEAFNSGVDIVRSTVDWTLGSDVEKLYLLGTAISATGNALSNFIYGNALANTINGGAGADRFYGGNGSDTYIVDSAGDLVFETSAAGGTADAVQSSVNHTLSVNVENLTLTGVANIKGTGNTQANVISGNTGNNFINGLAGNDTLSGGGGNDQFVFTTAIGAANTDTITDFDVATDTIRLDDGTFTGLALGTLTAAAFTTGAAAADASDRIIYNSATGALLFDSDGLGGLAAKQFATLIGAPSLTNADFFVF